MRTARLTCFLVAALLAAAGVHAEPAPPWNLLLVSIDTLRADLLGVYGGPTRTTPNLDALARRAIVFERAYATAPITGPSHASILTAQHPSKHGIVFNGHRVEAKVGSRTLTEALRDAGFRTGAFVSAAPVDARYGFGRGFEHFDLVQGGNAPGDSGADGVAVIEAARDWIGTLAGQRFFVWVHLFKPHLPYAASSHIWTGLGMNRRIVVPNIEAALNTPPARLRTAYRADVNEADEQLGRLLGMLEGLSVLDRTMIAIVADHGEYLGEHGRASHNGLYDPVLRVPLLIAVPGGSRQRRSDPVSTVDLTPTLLHLLSLPPLATAQGRNLLADGAESSRVPVFAEWRAFQARDKQRGLVATDTLMSVQLGDHKLIRSLVPPFEEELYDLAADPGEERDLSRERPELLATLRGLLAEHARRNLPEGPLGVPRFEEGDLEMLRALGYVE